MEVSIDIHDQSGPAVTTAARSLPVASTSVFDDLDKAVDERVNAIVSANLGRPAKLKRAD
jgi:membrane fusion protein (multidrug efflux system)